MVFIVLIFLTVLSSLGKIQNISLPERLQNLMGKVRH